VEALDAVVHVDEALPERDQRESVSATEMAIGRHVASLVEDGATLQMGIGAIPDAVLRSLDRHRRLGVHSEMFSDGLIPLVESGAITGEEKKLQKGAVVSSFAFGTQRLYDFMHDNPVVKMLRVSDGTFRKTHSLCVCSSAPSTLPSV
jgi:4-hydroxybutyrate CoA-transferase